MQDHPQLFDDSPYKVEFGTSWKNWAKGAQWHGTKAEGPLVGPGEKLPSGNTAPAAMFTSKDVSIAQDFTKVVRKDEEGNAVRDKDGKRIIDTPGRVHPVHVTGTEMSPKEAITVSGSDPGFDHLQYKEAIDHERVPEGMIPRQFANHLYHSGYFSQPGNQTTSVPYHYPQYSSTASVTGREGITTFKDHLDREEAAGKVIRPEDRHVAEKGFHPFDPEITSRLPNQSERYHQMTLGEEPKEYG